MTLLYWLAVIVASVAVGIVLIGWGYLVGLKVAAVRVAMVREEMEKDREVRRTMLHQGGAR